MAQQIQIGDKVKFLDEVGGGIVKNILDSKTALVETSEGFEFPYPINKLIVVEKKTDEQESSHDQSFAQAQAGSLLYDTEPDIIKDNEEVKIYLAFIPKNLYQINSTDFEVHLVNDSNWHLLYLYQIPTDGKKLLKSTPGHLQPNLIELLMTINARELAKIGFITFQILFFRRTPHEQRKPVLAKITLKEQRLFNIDSYLDNDYFETKSLFYPIIEEHPLEEAIKQLKEHDFHKVKHEKEVKNKRLNTPKQFHSGKKPDLWEVDLHITELLDDTRGMSAKDMLEYQMQVFKDTLEQGLKDSNVKKIVFIHGRGNGRLRQEIRAYLDRKKIPYQDASFAKYGFGATMVFVDGRK